MLVSLWLRTSTTFFEVKNANVGVPELKSNQIDSGDLTLFFNVMQLGCNQSQNSARLTQGLSQHCVSHQSLTSNTAHFGYVLIGRASVNVRCWSCRPKSLNHIGAAWSLTSSIVNICEQVHHSFNMWIWLLFECSARMIAQRIAISNPVGKSHGSQNIPLSDGWCHIAFFFFFFFYISDNLSKLLSTVEQISFSVPRLSKPKNRDHR